MSREREQGKRSAGSLVVPFLKEGIEAGKPTLASFGERNSTLVQSALTDISGLVSVPAGEQYSRPAATLRSCAQFVQSHLASGAHQVRMIGDVPNSGMGLPWSPWARFESVANHAFSSYPLWHLCPYDTRMISPEEREDVERAHPRVATADGGHTLNDKYLSPSDFFGRLAEAPPDAIEASPPVLEALDPTASAARAAVARLEGLSLVKPDELRNLIIAVSEVVTNARMHGRSPVTMRAWAAPDRLLVSVHDARRSLGPICRVCPGRQGRLGRVRVVDRPSGVQSSGLSSFGRWVHGQAHRRRAVPSDIKPEGVIGWPPMARLPVRWYYFLFRP